MRVLLTMGNNTLVLEPERAERVIDALGPSVEVLHKEWDSKASAYKPLTVKVVPTSEAIHVAVSSMPEDEYAAVKFVTEATK